MGRGGNGKGGGKDPAKCFCVKLRGQFKPYGDQEDKILKRAYMAGFPHAKFELRGQHYKYDFTTMEQCNLDSGKERAIRQPQGWKQPKEPVVPPGPTMTVKVPQGGAGGTIQVPHPRLPGQFINVNVPAGAKPGQAMLVPVPATGEPKAEDAGDGGGGGWSTGAKVAGGAALGAGAVGGALLGVAVAEHGADAVFGGIADGAEGFAADAGDWGADAAGDVGDWGADAFGDVGDWGADAFGDVGDFAGDAVGDIGDFAGDAGDFLMDGADDAGDLIMDLF